VHAKQAAECREQEAETTFAAGNGRTIAWLSREFVRALGAVELSPPQYRILILLSDGSAMSSSLATRLAVSPPSITSVVDGLVNRGLVERHHGGDDRRRVALVLTEEGLAALARADHQMDVMASDLAANLGDPDLAGQALDGLQLWSDALVARHKARRAEPQKSEALKSEAQPTDVPR
jgi:long-chain acyl-CoA synthetase